MYRISNFDDAAGFVTKIVKSYDGGECLAKLKLSLLQRSEAQFNKPICITLQSEFELFLIRKTN